MGKFYNWHDTMSRQTGTNGEFCIVVGARGIGKTFGLRKQFVLDWIRDGSRFCEVCRNAAELPFVMQGYFDKLQAKGLFSEYEFKCEKNAAFARRLPFDDDNQNEWDCIGYFVALTQFQRDKKRTFANVKRVVFDEAILDRKDKHHRYLPNEFAIFANMVSTVLREEPGVPTKGKVYLLGNACDLCAPYLFNLGIRKVPPFGFSYHNGKHTLLHYVEAVGAREREAETLVGRMLAGNEEAKTMFDNVFQDANDEFIESKTSNAKFAYGIRFQKMSFGVWLDWSNGLFYVNEKIPNNERNVYTLTKSDATIDYQSARKTNAQLQVLVDCFYMGAVRYSSPAIREAFLNVLTFFGVS